MTEQPLLARLDSAHDALENRAFCHQAGVDFLIKWNPRQQDAKGWLAYAEARSQWQTPRVGKRVALFSVVEAQTHKGQPYRFRALTFGSPGDARGRAQHRPARPASADT